jgi:hypothetical protein
MSVLEAYTDRIVTPQATNFRFGGGFSKRASERASFFLIQIFFLKN